VEKGILSKERMERYLKLVRETRFNARRAIPAKGVSGKKPRSKAWITEE
jgi:hypothetical protein